jgi:D-hydroxyproline dehydrogenase subunit beta
LHLAYQEDEEQVLHEFVRQRRDDRQPCELWTARQICDRSPFVEPRGLRCGLWSSTEIAIDPRQCVAAIPQWLSRSAGVHFEFDCPVLGYDRPHVFTPRGTYRADQLLVCCGDELQTLYATCFAGSGLTRCKLQMMRSLPLEGGWRFGPMLAAGLTLQHYKSFAHCPSLPRLVQRFQRELPQYLDWGIHVMATQNGQGELVLGDSHEYGDAIEPFDKAAIDELILRYLRSFLRVDGLLTIGGRWHGIYLKHPKRPYFVATPADGVTVVTGLGGAGMTMSFGLADKLIREREIAAE